MRIPANLNRYKNDGRTIDTDLNDPVIHQLSEKEGKAATIRFVEWLRSYGWRVSTEQSGRMQDREVDFGVGEVCSELGAVAPG